MFDLEKAIKRWKKSLHRYETFEDGFVADIELHLRDAFDLSKESGLGGEEAFRAALAQVGTAESIALEYFKNRTGSLGGRPPWRASQFTPALAANYLKTAWRKIKRQKGYSLINIAGLAVGLACCILILLWVNDEASYDRHYENAGRIYRLIYTEEIGGVTSRLAVAPFAAAPALASELPEIESTARLLFLGAALVTAGDRKFDDERGIYYSEPGFFKVFSHAFIEGTPDTALAGPGSIVLTEETARKYFGKASALGKTVNLNRQFDLRVTGVIKDVPKNSHFRFRAMASMSTIQDRKVIRELLEMWTGVAGWTYLLLGEQADPGAVEKKFAALVDKYTGEEARKGGLKQEFLLQRVTDIHLRSHLDGEIESNGSIQYVYAFSLLAAFILAIACINFMNLSTARSAGRGKEVGMRKVLGAQRKNLILQFLGESVLMVFLAMAVGLVLVVLALPSFNRLADKSLQAAFLLRGGPVLGLVLLVVLTGALAGSYPALFLSAFRPVAVLKEKIGKGMRRSLFRSVLVVFQFSISVVLMAGTLIILRQIQYMKSLDLGFDKSQVLVVRLKDPALRRDVETLKNELKRNPKILQATVSNGFPGRVDYVLTVNMEGRPESESHSMDVIFADFDFARTYGLEIMKGRDFSRDFSTDLKEAFLINETAAKKLGWGPDAIGRKIGFSMDEMGPIIGIMKDFNYRSLREKIGPLVVKINPEERIFLSLKISGDDVAGTVASIKNIWKSKTERDFDAFFVDEEFDSLYRSEERLGKTIGVFAFMAIFVACLGLFGLASFGAEQRTKEIGVRKVLGASEMNLAASLSREFLKWVILANVVALPAAYILMTRLWLSNFVYRTSPSLWVFALVAGFSLLIAILTVSYRAIKAALANPVESLRYE